VSTRAQVLNLLRDLQASEGIAFLFITHDFGAVAAMSDVVGVLEGGNLVECTSAANVLRKPENSYTRKLLNAVPRLAPASMNSQ
jgi:peptide/nickel transport system ATP-binding protein